MYKFDYESKVWGAGEVTTSPFCLTAPKLIFALKSLKKLRKKDMVLEVGCGAGGVAKAVKRHRSGLQVFGIDVSKTEIAIAKKNCGGVNFKIGSAYKLPFKSKSFDAVLMFDVLEHLDNPEKALQEINRVLAPKGIFSLFTPLEGYLFSLHGIFTKLFGFTPKEKYGGHIQQFTNSQVDRLLMSTGFKPIKREFYGHLFNQIVDFTYFCWLYLRGKNVKGSIESMIDGKTDLKSKIIGKMKNLIAIISFIESKLLFFFPGSGASILSIANAGSQKTSQKA